MKLKILKNFQDKHTKVNYVINDVITVEKARGEELLAHPLKLVSLVNEKVEEVKEPKKETKKKASKE